MKKKIADMWVKALRSGKFKQGTDALCLLNDSKKPQYCCLGVLCEIYNQEHKIKLKTNTVVTSGVGKIRSYNDSTDVPPLKVQRWAGLRTETGEITGSNGVGLVPLNDNGSSFKKIAKVIQEEYKNL